MKNKFVITEQNINQIRGPVRVNSPQNSDKNLSQVKNRIKDYFSKLKKMEDLYIINPGRGEVDTANLFAGWLKNVISDKSQKVYAIVTKNFPQLESVIVKLKSVGVSQVKRLVIGSHGDGYYLLMDSEGGRANAKFLTKLTPLLAPNGIIYFTACYGAQSLQVLHQASLAVKKIGRAHV